MPQEAATRHDSGTFIFRLEPGGSGLYRASASSRARHATLRHAGPRLLSARAEAEIDDGRIARAQVLFLISVPGQPAPLHASGHR